ncbi:hypothetical protein LWC33_13180 [Pseudonocardia sp. RS11V-5]|uniref:hypothetical protein n=1 Tax=Pseudonocardia terrae TaxID=2905831 RepID=UPI001E5CE543|nr:hypothetical protein [Pseudonocardia terrae]MCE3552410.1 hypothetical protein [Pseudonocardia terrae]
MTTDWQEPLTAAEVVDRLTIATGRDPEVASAMIRDYLDDTSERLGVSVHRWGLDAGDVDEIRRAYEWVDYERGETAAQARARAAEYAEGWAEIAGTADDSPGYSGHVGRQASLWAERARGFKPRVEDEAAREAVSAATVRDRPAAYIVGGEQQDGDEDGWSQ